MPNHTEDRQWAKNYAKQMSKQAKTDSEKRRWFNLFLVLSKLVKIEILDDTSAKPALANEVPMPNIDAEVAAKLKKIKNGGDSDGGSTAVSTGLSNAS